MRYGFALTTAGIVAAAGIVGTLALKMASYRSTAGLVIHRTNSVAAPTCFEYFVTPSCQPPTVPTDGLFPVCGRTVTANLPLTGVVWLAEQAYGQLRMNAALPESNAFPASPS